MSVPINSASTKFGNSLEADKIYQYYVQCYNTINANVHEIDGFPLPADQQGKLNVQNAKAGLLALQKELYSTYISNYSNPCATLESFKTNCLLIENQRINLFNYAIGGGSSVKAQIQHKLVQAQSIITHLTHQIDLIHQSSNQLMNSQSAFKVSIDKLQKQISALPENDQQKTKAQNDLNAAKQILIKLESQIVAAQSQLNTFQGMLNTIMGSKGPLDQLQQLALVQNPDQSDLNWASVDLQNVLAAKEYEENTLQATLSVISHHLLCIEDKIQTVKMDLLPKTEIEHGAWYIDWTSWDYPIPEGVNTVNIFVGNMHLDLSGNPVIDGFGNMNFAKMEEFIKSCHSKGIVVKISLGGGGGSYDNCWDAVTTKNVQKFAQTLADFCHVHGVDGVDFDVEKFHSSQDKPDQQKLVGTFIKTFKSIDPNFKTTLCTNAGFGPYFPWQGIVQNIMDGASNIDEITGIKNCAVDRLYIMSYYNTLSEEKGWVTGWANWLKNEYHYKPSQITVGLDDFDAHAYDIKEFAAWAATQGYSTCYWAWNPATKDHSNKSTNDIANAYEHHWLQIPV